jgi:hypothetical protein
MKVSQISVTISQAINTGNYEAIKPSVTLTAELDDGETASDCIPKLHGLASKMWAKQALIELSWVRKRKGDNSHEFNETVKGTKEQLKEMLS